MNTATASVVDPKKELRSLAATAWEDLAGGLRKTQLWGRIGWLDVKRRYRRTMLGAFWSSITLAVYTGSVGIVGAGLFHQNIHNYLPYLISGMIVWTLLSLIINEACTLFVAGHALFRNVRFEYSILAYALVWRNFIVFLHNMAVYALVVAVLRPELLLDPTLLLAIPGLILVLVNGVWIALLIGLLCLRFRDIQQLVQTVIQILTLVTPIFWSADGLTGLRQLVFVQLNPVYRMIEIVRAPLLGQIPTSSDYLAALGITIAGWSLSYWMFQNFRKRIAYWS
ncbi:MAG TPA: ABC transporter permease [Alphaproteobacteria bacterium]